MPELVIKGATVIDGTGAEGRRADIGIDGGRITAVGDTDGPADATIDADGLVACPGFIDPHTHYDAPALPGTPGPPPPTCSGSPP